jgi:hypothetical protein
MSGAAHLLGALQGALLALEAEDAVAARVEVEAALETCAALAANGARLGAAGLAELARVHALGREAAARRAAHLAEALGAAGSARRAAAAYRR